MTTLVAPPRSAKATLCLSFALVFLCGAVSGAIALNVTNKIRAQHSVHKPLNTRFELQHLRRELDLTEDQTNQLSSILDDLTLYYDHLLGDGQSRLMQLLDQKQKDKFKELLEKEGH
jgi:hypothetical protein